MKHGHVTGTRQFRRPRPHATPQYQPQEEAWIRFQATGAVPGTEPVAVPGAQVPWEEALAAYLAAETRPQRPPQQVRRA